MVKIVLPPLIVLTDSQGNWGRRSGRLSVGQALRSASPLRAGLASGGRSGSGVGRARALGCWAPSGDVGSRAVFFNGLAGGLEVFFLGWE